MILGTTTTGRAHATVNPKARALDWSIPSSRPTALAIALPPGCGCAHAIRRRARRLRAPGSGSPGRRLNRAFFSCGKTCVHRPGRSADCPCPVRAQPAGCPASTGCWLNPGAVARYYGFQFSISNSVWILRFRAPLSVGEFRKTRHPRSVEFNKINETCFSGAGNSRFPEAWSL
jgi:hypothetical protein